MMFALELLDDSSNGKAWSGSPMVAWADVGSSKRLSEALRRKTPTQRWHSKEG